MDGTALTGSSKDWAMFEIDAAMSGVLVPLPSISFGLLAEGSMPTTKRVPKRGTFALGSSLPWKRGPITDFSMIIKKNELSEIRGYAILTANPFVFPELLAIIDIRSDK